MGYYSDPTAAMALGSINREFARQEKKARQILKRYKNGQISEEELERSYDQFRGLYKYVLDFELRKQLAGQK